MARRYDRNFVPNVSLSVEPFEEVRKQRAAESLAALESELAAGTDDMAPAAKRRRGGQSSAVDGRPTATDDDDDDEDNVSVSSDKRELLNPKRAYTMTARKNYRHKLFICYFHGLKKYSKNGK